MALPIGHVPISRYATSRLQRGLGGTGSALPRWICFPDMNDRGGHSVDDSSLAPASVEGTIGGHAADLIVLADLVEKLGQDRAAAASAWSCRWASSLSGSGWARALSGGLLDLMDLRCELSVVEFSNIAPIFHEANAKIKILFVKRIFSDKPPSVGREWIAN